MVASTQSSLSSFPTARETLARFGLRHSKDLGQHFLEEDAIFETILGAAALEKDDVVLEIGPGPGTLTARLASIVRFVHAFELDRAYIEALRTLFDERRMQNIALHHQNAAQLDLALFCKENDLSKGSYKLVANLPYNITSRVLRLFLESTCSPKSMTVLVQKEVAERVVAAPGSMSMLSVVVQAYGDPSIIEEVPPEAFSPPPKVVSAVLHVAVRPEWAFVSPPESLFRMAKIGFSGKRKQLHNNLTAGFSCDKENVAQICKEARVDSTRRAQTLTLAEWDALAVRIDDFSACA